MRFSIAAILGLAAFVAAADNSTMTNAASSASSISSASAPTSSSAVQICLASCGTADICCQAKCVNVPCPNGSQINATTECAAQCPQGDGSQSDTDKYAACQQKCISSYFFSSGAVAAATGNSGSGSNGAASASATGTGTATRSGSSSGTASATGSSASHNAASEIRFGATGAALLGLFALGLAL